MAPSRNYVLTCGRLAGVAALPAGPAAVSMQRSMRFASTLRATAESSCFLSLHDTGCAPQLKACAFFTLHDTRCVLQLRACAFYFARHTLFATAKNLRCDRCTTHTACCFSEVALFKLRMQISQKRRDAVSRCESFSIFKGGGVGRHQCLCLYRVAKTSSHQEEVAFDLDFFGSSTAWMLGRTPPDAMVTPPSSLLSSSSLRTAS